MYGTEWFKTRPSINRPTPSNASLRVPTGPCTSHLALDPSSSLTQPLLHLSQYANQKHAPPGLLEEVADVLDLLGLWWLGSGKGKGERGRQSVDRSVASRDRSANRSAGSSTSCAFNGRTPRSSGMIDRDQGPHRLDCRPPQPSP